MADEWKKVEMSPTWDFEKEPELIGIYESREEKIGPNESMLYTFKKTDGSKISVWGNTLLDTRFKNLNPGEEVKIEYLGKVTSEKSGRSYHNFDVFHKEVPFKKVDEVNPDDVPF